MVRKPRFQGSLHQGTK